ncbi:N-acetylneuraminate synthase family protein [sulfur-oxidizing endosymbiont of Gigantopelta aegis]|uniref:N-acetylneuraminate synthase family protein n=1 Tax=sulfur-oxidizing endosymbiont of Gigantopelta aegis TaxID=2794934 RepID=UPI001FEAA4A4|nr:N-acetylneuraminate synthase family protein [sulfur-oxidizing endosymbiont of Gigantopelta aegis]
MASLKLNDSTMISDYGRPYIVAEVNTSHFGHMDTAKAMIVEAKKSGCDCVKFQSWSADSLYSQIYYDELPFAKRMADKFSFSESELAEIADFCSVTEIAFASTPYSKAEVDFLVERCQVPYIKVASMDLNNHFFLDYIARSGVPIVLSTGMGDLEEIHSAIASIKQTGNNAICLLHCISIYPPEVSTIRLNNIIGLRKEFPDYPIGFSDHSIGTEIATAATALGACMIEKHFTLDKTRIGMDNQMAMEPNEMSLMVNHCRIVQQALGDEERIVLSEEIEQRTKMRRSIIATKDLSAGTQLTTDDLDVKRPGTGLPPEKMKQLIGKILVQDVKENTLITVADFAQ